MSVGFVSGAIAVGGTTSRLDKDYDVVWKKTFVFQSETISFNLLFFFSHSSWGVWMRHKSP